MGPRASNSCTPNFRRRAAHQSRPHPLHPPMNPPPRGPSATPSAAMPRPARAAHRAPAALQLPGRRLLRPAQVCPSVVPGSSVLPGADGRRTRRGHEGSANSPPPATPCWLYPATALLPDTTPRHGLLLGGGRAARQDGRASGKAGCRATCKAGWEGELQSGRLSRPAHTGCTGLRGELHIRAGEGSRGGGHGQRAALQLVVPSAAPGGPGPGVAWTCSA
jgi:hypothetical protein